MTNGRKYDKGKLRFSLLPPQAVKGILEVLEYGSAKYDDHNWLYVEDPCTRYSDALQRHMAAMEQGELYDAESNLPHAWHMCCCAVLLGFHFMNTPAARLQWIKRQARAESEPAQIELPIEIEPPPTLDVGTPHQHVWELVHTDVLKAWHCTCGANVRETAQGRYNRFDAAGEFVSAHATYFQATHIP